MTALWITALVALSFGQLIRPHPAVLTMLVVAATAPLLSWLLLTTRQKLHMKLSAPGIVEKGKEFFLTLQLEWDTCLPVGRVEVLLELHNTATGEKTRQRLRLSKQTQFPVCSDHCGCIVCRVVWLRCREMFGLLPIASIAGSSRQIVVMPRLFPVELQQTLSVQRDMDSEEYAPQQRGFDRTETLQIREYVPGDTLQQIHWKLSSKHRQLMVREGSLPADRSLTVFLDLADDTRAPAVADALLEAVGSLCQALAEVGSPFRLAWNADAMQYASVAGTEQLPEALCRLLKARPDPAAVPGNTVWLQRMSGCVLYFCSSLPPEPWPERGVRFFLCGETETDFVTAFTPENVSQQLRLL